MKAELFPVKTPIVKPGDDYVGIVLQSIKDHGIEIMDNDIIVITSKIVSTALNFTANLDEVQPSERAIAMAQEMKLDPFNAKVITVILRESEEEYGAIAYQKEKFFAMWTKKNNSLSINAGVDRKNSPPGHISLEIQNPHGIADDIRKDVVKRIGKRVGILIIDSTWIPLRNGTVGFTIGLSGFNPVRDCTIDEQGNRATDVYGRPIPIARHNVADDLAAGAHLLMGETGEGVPVVLIRGMPVKYEENADVKSLYMREEEDPFFLVFQPKKKIVERPQWRD